jgi:lactate dehydrogenase-like 2-hydroxyacid dehydrogenase
MPTNIESAPEPSTPCATVAPSSAPNVLVMGPYPDWDMKPLDQAYCLHKLWESPDRDVTLEQIAADVRAIATRGELGASGELISRLPNLEIIACYGVGTDAIDLAAARQRGIRVTNTPAILNKDVADMAIALMLAVLRRIPDGDRYVREGKWPERNMELTSSLTGKTVGIVGFGRIGAEVAQRAAAFDTKIAYTDLNRRADSPHEFHASVLELAKVSDVLVVTVSGGPLTKHIINADVLQALGPRGVLINVSRGTTVDEDALIHALTSGIIAAAGLDVFMNEPNIDGRFLQLSNVVLQPHHSSGTVETRKAMGKLVRDNLEAHFSGQPLLTPVV